MTTLYSTIHGLTTWNEMGLCQGHMDTPLSEAGEGMATALARAFGPGDLDAIVTSDLSRAYRTAEPLAARLGTRIEQRSDLREGRWEKMASREGIRLLPFPVEVETGSDLSIRVTAALDEICRNHHGERVLLVTHGGVQRALVEHLRTLGVSMPEYRGARVAISKFILSAGTWTCAYLNDTRHLDGDASTRDFG